MYRHGMVTFNPYPCHGTWRQRQPEHVLTSLHIVSKMCEGLVHKRKGREELTDTFYDDFKLKITL